AHTLSQLLHGEHAALQLCGQLTNACPKMDEKWYAASQVVDEARHIEVISKFLQRKVGMIYPINPTLKILLDRLLEAEGPQKKTLGMQTLFEGMAVGIMDLMRTESRNPLLTDMLRILGPEYGIGPGSVVQMAVSLPNFAGFNSMPYMHTVIPDFVHVGPLT